MRTASIAAFLAVTLAGPMVWADDNGVAPARVIHRSISVVTSVDRGAGFLVIKQDDGQLLRISVDKATVGDQLEALQPGDIIREECTRGEGGILRARLILLVRPAWAEIGSPEM